MINSEEYFNDNEGESYELCKTTAQYKRLMDDIARARAYPEEAVKDTHRSVSEMGIKTVYNIMR